VLDAVVDGVLDGVALDAVVDGGVAGVPGVDGVADGVVVVGVPGGVMPVDAVGDVADLLSPVVDAEPQMSSFETLPASVLITIQGGKVFLTAIFKLSRTGGAYCRAIEGEKPRGEDRKPALR